MGREIRRVAADWVHPRDDRGQFKPIYDEAYLPALNEWWEAHQRWERGEDPDRQYCDEKYPGKYRFFAEWNGSAPNEPDLYRPDWSDEERTHYQLYETVSEGTPLSPPMPSPEALADWLSENRDYWGNSWSREQALAMAEIGWAPSMIWTGSQLLDAQESVEWDAAHRSDQQ